MGKKKYRIVIPMAILMISSSLCLLVILQIFWLKSSYEKAFFDFTRETNYIFRNSVFNSVFEKSFRAIADSTSHFIPDSLDRRIGFTQRRHHAGDTVKNVQIYVSAIHADSSKGGVGVPTSRIRAINGSGNFLIRLDPNNIGVDSITNIYRVALSKAGIEAPFFITNTKVFYQHLGPFPLNLHTSDNKDVLNPLSDTIRTEPVHISPLDQYYASFPNVRKVMISKISPQIFFSVFITLITTISFVIIYRGMRAQQKLIEIKNDFINNVTHELKTPVATVSVALEALQRFEVLDKPQLTQEYLNIARQELERLSQMTDSILKTSMLEKKDIEFAPERVNLDSIIQKMITRLTLVLESRGASLTYRKEGKDFEILGSADHLTNLFHNLVDNALKYSPLNPSIDIALSESDSVLAVSVKDNGKGIPKEFQEKIFEKFFRIPDGDVHNTKGYGLGLSYASSVVKSHHGTIEVFSEQNQGSEFKVTFPRTSKR